MAGDAGPIRVVIVDDEPLARERLRTLLAHEPDMQIIAECSDGREAIEAIDREPPDLLFLDVQMPEVDGFEVLAGVDYERIPAIVFVTAYDRHALRAFDVHALDYLLKPFDRERFARALARARAHLERERTPGGIERRLVALLDELRAEKKFLERLVVREAGRVTFLRTEEIDWIEAAGNYARLHAGGASHLVRDTMKALETRLDPGRFARVHRSAIVNVDRIQELHPSFHGEYIIVMRSGARLTSSRGYSDRLHELLDRGR